MAIAIDLLMRSYRPYKYVMTYKFSQDHIELLFNKIRRHCGWNNNPDVLQFKYALRRMLIRNSIKPSNTGNCTDFNESLCDPSTFLTLSWKKNESVPLDSDTHNDEETLEVERMLIDMDETFPNDLRDNILYYISGFLVRKNASKC